jgi:hypothetical protein
LKRVLADHNVPAPLLRLLKAVDIKTASSQGWQKLMNGKLLAVAEEAGFEVLLSGDKTIKDELLIGGRKIGMVCMSDNHWPAVAEYGGKIGEAIEKVKPGQILSVFCGQFSRGKTKRKPAP